MLDGNRIFEKAKEISGCTDDALVSFCENTAAVINNKLRTDVDASDVRLLTAAAKAAYSEYLIMQNISECDTESIKAGDVSIRRNSDAVIGYAENLRKNAFAEIAGFLVDSDFYFRSV